MKYKLSKKAWIIFFVASTLIIMSCVSNNDTSHASNTVSGDPQIKETARFLAGKSIQEDSPLYKFTQTKFYRHYTSQIQAGWNKFQKPNLEKITKWWGKYQPDEDYDTVLYPFSGPDIIHALTFYPDATTYVLFGLERPGDLPQPHSLPDYKKRIGLENVRKSLCTIFNVNFFRTKGMAKNLTCRGFAGMTPIAMFFLALNDYDVLKVEKIAIDKNGDIAPWQPSDERIRWQSPVKNRIPGVEITFRKGSGRIKKLRYYNLNVINRALIPNSMNFITYLGKEAPYNTLIKSASYLMHNKDKFSKIREAVLNNSNFIVQDESGIPIKYFGEDTWRIQFHGYYRRPIPLFNHRYQPDLKKAMEKESTGLLPFSYGYNVKKSNLMTVERKDYLEK
jgi:hypothetical protein